MKHAPIPDFADMAEAIAWCHAEIDRFRANPVPRRPAPIFIPAGMTEADRLCRVCRGFGTFYDHYSDGFTAAVACHECRGSGLR